MLYNFFKVSALALTLISTSVHAGEYKDEGYIEWIKSNKDNHCWGNMLWNSQGTKGQGFYLVNCNPEMMSLLRLAQITGSKVTLNLEGNGQAYKPLLGVTIYRSQ